jgi:hypothetical protein
MSKETNVIIPFEFNIPNKMINNLQIDLIYCIESNDKDDLLKIIDEFKNIHMKKPNILLTILYNKNIVNTFFINFKDIQMEFDNIITFKNISTYKEICYEIINNDIEIYLDKKDYINKKNKNYQLYGLQVIKKYPIQILNNINYTKKEINSIAIILSGRIVHYEKCLLPILEELNKYYKIHLFISVNDNDKPYYDNAKNKLEKYLKCFSLEIYKIPEWLKNIHCCNYEGNKQKYPNKYKKGIYNCLSMYYNDNKAFNMSLSYAKKNNIKYDYFLKFRADLYDVNIEQLINYMNIKNNILNVVKPKCFYKMSGIHKVMCISDCFAWGNINIMKTYFNTYNFILEKVKEFKGKYWIWYEECITDSIYENKIKFTYIRLLYKILQKSKQPGNTDFMAYSLK